MLHPYEALKLQNSALLAGCYTLASVRHEVDLICDKALKHLAEYTDLENETRVRVVVTAGIHYRESDMDFSKSLAQGDPWNERSRHIPISGPFHSFAESGAYAFHLDHLDQVAGMPEGWTLERAVYEDELYNGFGPRDHGKHSGYPWAGTNIYDGGKYVADGVWDPNAIDRQLGTVPLMLRLMELEPKLLLPRANPTVTAHTVIPAPAPVPVGVGGTSDEVTRDARWLQAALNMLRGIPADAEEALTIDGSYGRQTRNVVHAYQEFFGLDADGLAGPATVGSIEKKLGPDGVAKVDAVLSAR
jgi:lysozyme family protein